MGMTIKSQRERGRERVRFTKSMQLEGKKDEIKRSLI